MKNIVISYGDQTNENFKSTNIIKREVILESREEAEKVLEHLRKFIKHYREVCVTDFNALVGINSSFSDYNLGWHDLTEACVTKVFDGYLLSLPTPVFLDVSKQNNIVLQTQDEADKVLTSLAYLLIDHNIITSNQIEQIKGIKSINIAISLL
ncbi:MAG: hypothetical protein LBD57_04395 [Endomicrobium sp.]|uniref:hypothetical protein n=1 Tax=Candidatus Endomicrobiellum cubanum TaxID=3242325 RepID=UPI002831DF7B|nr:hypothetical protein [Endomicrobium sp.]